MTKNRTRPKRDMHRRYPYWENLERRELPPPIPEESLPLEIMGNTVTVCIAETKVPLVHSDCVTHVNHNATKSRVVTFSIDRYIRVWSLPFGHLLEQAEYPIADCDIVRSVRFGPSDTIIANVDDVAPGMDRITNWVSKRVQRLKRVYIWHDLKLYPHNFPGQTVVIHNGTIHIDGEPYISMTENMELALLGQWPASHLYDRRVWRVAARYLYSNFSSPAEYV